MGCIEESYNRSWTERLGRELKSDSRLHLEIAAGIVPPCQKFLDIGCGDGYMATLIQDRCSRIFGIDISPTALKQAEGRGYSHLQRLDLNEERLPYGDGYFDVVVCLDILEHIFDPENLLKEIHRVIRRGGILIVSVPNLRYLKYILILVIRGRVPLTSGDPFIYEGGHCHYFTNKSLTGLLNKCGFKVEWRRGIIPSERFRFLELFSRTQMVIEWLSPSLLIKAVKIEREENELER